VAGQRLRHFRQTGRARPAAWLGRANTGLPGRWKLPAESGRLAAAHGGAAHCHACQLQDHRSRLGNRANLGNRRDATQQSELGEDQFYRLPARRVDVSLTVPFR
jgi:hypothetical protein